MPRRQVGNAVKEGGNSEYRGCDSTHPNVDMPEKNAQRKQVGVGPSTKSQLEQHTSELVVGKNSEARVLQQGV